MSLSGANPKLFTFTVDDHSFSVDLNSKNSRDECLEEIKKVTGKSYFWFRDNTDNKNWILCSEEEYKAKNNRFRCYLHLKYGFYV